MIGLGRYPTALRIAAVIAVAGGAAAGLLQLPTLPRALLIAAGAVAAFAFAPTVQTRVTEWMERQRRIERLVKHPPHLKRSGIPRVRDWSDAHDLGVQLAIRFRAASNEAEQPGKDALPLYVKRDADKELAQRCERGGLVVIGGPAVAGKTRTAFEAMQDPTRLARWLTRREPPRISRPQTESVTSSPEQA